MQNSDLSCVVCGNEFSSFGQLKIHKKIHVSQQGLKCGICNRVYLSKKLFVKHLQSHEKPRFFNCLECNKTFPNKTRLRTHSRSHTGERPFKCSQCNSYFGSKYQVKLHERRHTGEKPHCCAVCKKRFSASSGLAQHMKIHTTDSPYSCSVCNKSFKHKEKLENHSRIHTGAKPYMCDQCPLVFRLKHALVRHLRIHLGQTYKCSLCPKKFGELYALKKHHRNKHTHNDFPGPATGENIKGCDVEMLSKNNTTKSKVKQGQDIPNKKRKNIKRAASHLGKFVSDKCFLTIRERDTSSLVEENGWHLIPLPESNKSFNANVTNKISIKEHCGNEAVQHQIGLQISQQSESRECCTRQEVKNMKLCENEAKIQEMTSCDRKTCILRHEMTGNFPSLMRTKPVPVKKGLAQTSTIEYFGDKGKFSVDDCPATSEKSYEMVEINSNTAPSSRHMQLNQMVFEKGATRNRFHGTDDFTSIGPNVVARPAHNVVACPAHNVVTHPAHNVVTHPAHNVVARPAHNVVTRPAHNVLTRPAQNPQHYGRENYHREEAGHFSRLCNNGCSSSGPHYKLGPDFTQQQSDQLYVPARDSHYDLTVTAVASSHQSKGHQYLYHPEPEGKLPGFGENRLMPNLLHPLDQSNFTIYFEHTHHISGMTSSQGRSAEASRGGNKKHLSGFSLNQGRYEGPQEISFHGGSNVVHHMPEPSLLEVDNEEDTGPIKWSVCEYNSHLRSDPKHHYQDMYRAGKSKCALLCGVSRETDAHSDTESFRTRSDTFGKTHHQSDKESQGLTPDHNPVTIGETPQSGVGFECTPHPKNKVETNYPEVTGKSKNIPDLRVREYTSRTQHSDASKSSVSTFYQLPSVAPTSDSNLSCLHSTSFKNTDQKSDLRAGKTIAVIGSCLPCQSKQMDLTSDTCNCNLKSAVLLGQCLGDISIRGKIQTRGITPMRGLSPENSDCSVEKSQHSMSDCAVNTQNSQNSELVSENSTHGGEEYYKVDDPSPALEFDHHPVIYHKNCGRPEQGLQDAAVQNGLGNEDQEMRHENLSGTVMWDKSFKPGRPFQFENNSPVAEGFCGKNKKEEVVGEYGETKKNEDGVFEGEVCVVAMKKLIKSRETKTNTKATTRSKKWKRNDMSKKECLKKTEEVQPDKPNVEPAGTGITSSYDGRQPEANKTLGREPANTQSRPKIRAASAEPKPDLSLADLNKVDPVHPTVTESNENNNKLGGMDSEISESLLCDLSQQEAGRSLTRRQKSCQNDARGEFVNANCIIDDDLDLRRCRLCGNEYKNIGCLKKHIFTSHFKGAGHGCKICNKHFPHKSRLDRHMKTHVGRKPFPCSMCDQGFTAQKHLDNHMKRHTKEPAVFVCDECGKTFPRRYQLKVHQRTHSGEKPYKCSHCRACFATSFQVHLHERVHTGERPYQCRYCGKCFRGSANLSLHVKSHTDNRPYLCATCGASFREAGKLKAHIRIHTGARPFMCDQCPKVFKVKHQLVKHMRWHSGDVFKCQYCDKSFDEKWVRKKHVSKQHPDKQTFN